MSLLSFNAIRPSSRRVDLTCGTCGGAMIFTEQHKANPPAADGCTVANLYRCAAGHMAADRFDADGLHLKTTNPVPEVTEVYINGVRVPGQPA